MTLVWVAGAGNTRTGWKVRIGVGKDWADWLGVLESYVSVVRKRITAKKMMTT